MPTVAGLTRSYKGTRPWAAKQPAGPCLRRRSARALTRMRALEPDNASVMVCGGAGVAMHTTRKLKDMGAWVWMMQRSDNNRAEIEKMMAFCVKGDALDKESVEKAVNSIDDLDAVVSTVGGSVKDARADSEGNINIINAAQQRGVKKFVLVTSLGTGNSKGAVSPEVYDVLKPVLFEKEKAEQALMEQEDMTWVIIRPGGLTNDPKTGKGFLTESTSVSGAIARPDVAQLVAKALFTESVDNKVVVALDEERVTSASGDYEKIVLS